MIYIVYIVYIPQTSLLHDNITLHKNNKYNPLKMLKNEYNAYLPSIKFA